MTAAVSGSLHRLRRCRAHHQAGAFAQPPILFPTAVLQVPTTGWLPCREAYFGGRRRRHSTTSKCQYRLLREFGLRMGGCSEGNNGQAFQLKYPADNGIKCHTTTQGAPSSRVCYAGGR